MSVKVVGRVKSLKTLGTDRVTCEGCKAVLEYISSDVVNGTMEDEVHGRAMDSEVSWVDCPECGSRVHI